MAFVLTPRFVPAYAPQCSPFGFSAPAPRPAYRYRVACAPPRRPQYSSFNHFFSQVDELLSEIDRQAQHEAAIEAQRAAHRQRQQRKRALRAQFAVTQNEQGWQVDGDIQGFEQDNINIEVTDEHTLRIAGNTEWQSENAQAQTDAAPAVEEPAKEVAEDKIDGATFTDAESATVGPDSDTESHKSYQATVEDDFEDLGAETASLISASSASSTVSAPAEPKGKEKAVEEPTPTEAAQQPQEQTPAQEEQERVHGSFERTFRFPERIDGANVRASFKDGTLNITVPRAPAQEVKKITIQ
jgi:HSP20 family molecular chaperone IbpA